MFAPNQERAARELLRVVRPGGKIGLANWTPDGFVGRFFGVVSARAPPPAGLRSPMEWGTEPRLAELFGFHATEIRTARRTYTFRYRSAEHWIDVFRTYFGPMRKAFEALDAAGQQSLHEALVELLGRSSRGNGGALCIPSDYLEVVVTK
jgi:hypothetical protein